MSAEPLDVEPLGLDDEARPPADGGSEWAALGVTLLAAPLFLLLGLGTLAVAGSVPLAAALAQLGARRDADGRGQRATAPVARTLSRLTPLLFALLPVALLARRLGAPLPTVARPDADLWVGVGAYALAGLELVQVLVRRLSDDGADEA